MGPKRSYLLGLLLLGSALPLNILTADTLHSQTRYREDPRVRRNRGRMAIIKAMELHAKVHAMLSQGSEDVNTMQKLLSECYDNQAIAISQMEALNREAKFRDPLFDRLIKEMYDWGKPGTLSAKEYIAANDYQAAIEIIERVRILHQRVSGAF